jgi:ABC-type multidrug transport system ATPase subunit
MAILYTNHNMHEVTRICDRVIFLDKGKIVSEDTPAGRKIKNIYEENRNLNYDH